MSGLAEMYASEAAARAANKASLPPLPVDGDIDPMSFEPDDFDLVDNLKAFGRGTLRLGTFAAEKLAKPATILRGSVLTAMGRMPAENYDKFVHDAWEGRTTITGSQFVELAVGASMWHQLDSASAVPGWVKTVVSPGQVLVKEPRVS